MKEKELRYYMFTASANIVLLFSTGAIIQSFLAAVGLSPEQIGKYSFCVSFVQILTLVISMFFADKIRKVPQIIGIFTLPSVLFFAVMIILAAADKIPADTAFVIAICACCFWNLFCGLRTVIEYKLPYYIADISEYPRIINTSGMVVGILGTTLTGVFVFCSQTFGYKKAAFAAFFAASLFALTAFAALYPIKTKISVHNDGFNGKIGLGVFRLKATRWFAVPNVVRGFSNGIMGMAAVIMLSTVTRDTALSSSLTTVSAVSTVLGCFFYRRVCMRIKTVNLALIGETVQFVSLMFLLTGKTTMFIIMYFAAYFGQIIVDNAVPVYVTEIAPYEYVGSYTAVRMLFFTAGTAIGSYISGVLAVDRPFVLIAVCAASQMLHVMSYFFYGRKK